MQLDPFRLHFVEKGECFVDLPVLHAEVNERGIGRPARTYPDFLHLVEEGEGLVHRSAPDLRVPIDEGVVDDLVGFDLLGLHFLEHRQRGVQPISFQTAIDDSPVDDFVDGQVLGLHIFEMLQRVIDLPVFNGRIKERRVDEDIGREMKDLPHLLQQKHRLVHLIMLQAPVDKNVEGHLVGLNPRLFHFLEKLQGHRRLVVFHAAVDEGVEDREIQLELRILHLPEKGQHAL